MPRGPGGTGRRGAPRRPSRAVAAGRARGPSARKAPTLPAPPAEPRARAGPPAEPISRPGPRATAPQTAGTPERIAKVLARAGAGSRRDIERMIADGRITLDGKPVTTPATLVASVAGLAVDGMAVESAAAARLFLFHKPPGFLTAARDPAGRPTIYDILPPGLPRLMPVGRLDLMTEGLLLLTNDGGLKRRLELPANGVPRTYRVRAIGDVRQADLEQLAMGVVVDGVRYGPVDAEIDRRASQGSANVWLTMRLREGKNREVRRLCEAMGLKVSRLIRTAFGPFDLGGLAPREVAEVPAADVERLGKRIRDRA